MKTKLKTVTLIGALLFSYLVVFGFGHYDGSEDRSRNYTTFDLGFDTLILDELHDNKTDFAKRQFKGIILGESQSLKYMDNSSFRHFLVEYQNRASKDDSRTLELADKAVSEE